MYYIGEGIQQDYSEAVKWYRKAAEQGEADAQLTLGFMYANGQSVSQDNVQAYMWYDLAASNGRDIAGYLKKLSKQMTQSQIDEAKRLARKWREKHNK
jgi:TPR repeat protein